MSFALGSCKNWKASQWYKGADVTHETCWIQLFWNIYTWVFARYLPRSSSLSVDAVDESEIQKWVVVPIQKKIAVIDKRLSMCRPPYDITRTPSSLLKILHWKAAEHRAFLLYYSTVLEGILPDPFYSHFRNLSYGMNIVLQQSV